MEYFELLDENGEKTGKIKEREAVHTDGDLHGGAHMWVVKNISGNGDFEVLLQKRHRNKDSFPGCLDISSAGHVAAGESFISTAVRELKEELNLEVTEKQLHFITKDRSGGKYTFHGKPFWNNELHYVYAVDLSVSLDTLSFQKEEIEGLVWQKASAVTEAISSGDSRYCIQTEEFRILMDFITGHWRS